VKSQLKYHNKKRTGTISKHKKTCLEDGQTRITTIYGRICVTASLSLRHILRFLSYPSIAVTRLACVDRPSSLGLFRINYYVFVFKKRAEACRKHCCTNDSVVNQNILITAKLFIFSLIPGSATLRSLWCRYSCVSIECIGKQGPFRRGQTPYQQGH
jgi:hypothetical protein